MIRDAATQAQVDAAEPCVSTWLAANAGSGKTRVLTERVARLLLEGVLPQNVLCLTYTKAAASEMQNRLFRQLGDWSMRPDDELRDALHKLGVDGSLGTDTLRRARTLFAGAIETPGGLRIQTIHSFCSALLRRFPLEAGVSPQFTEIEDRAAALLRAEILDQMAAGDDADLVRGVALELTDTDFDDFTRDVVSSRADFTHPKTRDQIANALGIDPKLDATDIAGMVFEPDTRSMLSRLAMIMGNSAKVTDQRISEKLRRLPESDVAAVHVLESICLTGASAKEPFSAKIGSIPTADVRKANPDLTAEFNDLIERVEAARWQRIALATTDRTTTLNRFAHKFLSHYAEAKTLRGWLDFDDLILKTRDLLSNPLVAQWVLYRLDGGIDHILVDEAQDTSPLQWQVIEKLAQEITSGDGAHTDRPRTVFVVGDKKQSIYSFQGADPSEFDHVKQEFAERLRDSGQPLITRELAHSFRSSHAILRLVDATLTGHAPAGFAGDLKHIAFHNDLPGRVDLWPVVPTVEKAKDTDWFRPVDHTPDTHHAVILARRIADEIKRMLDDKVAIPDHSDELGSHMRPVQAGDFMVLVQRRSDLFHEIIRACKARGLPIAGSDRLKVGAELAVRDLGALLAFLATPEDDLSLAAALRSPLFAWSEQDLFALAHAREGKFLWESLRAKRDEHPATLEILDDMRGQADFLRPYDLIERILSKHDGRRLLLGRLGPEAEDGINALLTQALAYERNEVPSLTGFLAWMETDDLEIKRQTASGGNQIRVMTVHGSKGLEAPIVILPDTAERRAPRRPRLIAGEEVVWWSPSKDETPMPVADLHDSLEEKIRQERLRLLYVAMTRAEKWLIVCGAGKTEQKDGQGWYQLIEHGLNSLNATQSNMPGGQGLRLEHGSWSTGVQDLGTAAEPKLPDLPEVFHKVAPEPVRPLETISPSELEGAKALAGEAGQDEEIAKERGSMIHLLLEHLPQVPSAQRRDRAVELIGIETPEFDALLQEVCALLENPELGHVFAPDTLAEAPITANLTELEGRRMYGLIDRLIVTNNTVLAVDFKSNAIIPASPEVTPKGILRQQGAYASALSQIYPDHEIQTAILWTKTGQLMMLPHDLVTVVL